MQTDLPDLTLIVHNLHEGAWGCDDDPDVDRLPGIIDQYRPHRPDIVIVTEVRDQRPYRTAQAHPSDHVDGCEADRERMAELGDPLGLALAGITPSRSGVPAAILYRPGRLHRAAWHEGASATFTNGNATAAFHLEGLAEPLAVTVLHADPWAWIDTLRETLRAIALTSEFYRWALIGGDWNSPPAYGPTADPARMRGHHRMNHLVDAQGPNAKPNLAAAAALADAGYADAAELVDACARRPGERRAEWFERNRTGTTGRIDRAYASEILAPAVTGYERLATHPGAGGRFPIAVTLNLARLTPHEPVRR